MTADPIGLNGGINLFAYINDNPIKNIDPLGLWVYWGKWCGPNWTGGKRETYTPGHKYDNPEDELDSCCMRHDKCYYICREKFACESNTRGDCMMRCDRVLAECSSAAGYHYSEPLWWWMKFNNSPDEGPNDCKCKNN
jgi:hypothetical protein